MERVAARHTVTVHYSTSSVFGSKGRTTRRGRTLDVEAVDYSSSTCMSVGKERGVGSGTDTRFWSIILEVFSRKKLKKEEVDHAEMRVLEVIGWERLEG